jgi:hypothetical protein
MKRNSWAQRHDHLTIHAGMLGASQTHGKRRDGSSALDHHPTPPCPCSSNLISNCGGKGGASEGCDTGRVSDFRGTRSTL